jgi:pilus assembly protein CpaB
VVEVNERNVGSARDAGMREALRRMGGLDPASTWLATTDADSVVPPTWLVQHVNYAEQGWDAVVGTATIYANEPVTESRLAVAGSGGGLAATIPTGMRACAVKVNDVVGVAGFVTPGMRVDVLITGVPPGADAETGPAVKTLLQNIQVLSAGANIEKDREGKPQQAQVVNLLVTPGQAEILSLAGNETRIQLVLRNPLDTGVTAPPGTVMSELFGQPRGPRPPVRISQPVGTPSPPAPSPAPRIEPPAVPSLRTVEVLNGPVRTQAKFESHGTIQ